MENTLLMHVEKVAHVGIAVPDLKEAEALYALLGFQAEGEIIEEENYGVRVQMMHNGESWIELLAPLKAGEPSPVDTYIATKPYKMYHIAYVCTDFEAQIELLKKNKFIMVDEPKPSKSLGGKKAVFMFNRRMGILELCEK